MAATAGKKARIKVATTSGGTYNLVAGIDTVSIDRDGQMVDVTTLTDADIVRLLGLRDCSIVASGNFEYPDTNGQGVIRSSYANDTPLFAQILPDGGTTVGAGDQVQVIVEKISKSASKDGKVAVSFSLKGSGAVSSV